MTNNTLRMKVMCINAICYWPRERLYIVVEKDYRKECFHFFLSLIKKECVVACRGRGGTVNQKICCLITHCNLQVGNPFHAKYMGMVLVYKQASLGFATTNRIS